jgi:hypothetical protein
MTRAEVARLLAFLTAALPHTTVTAETVAAWEAVLGDLDYATAERAVVRVLALQTAAWLPAPGAIREQAAKLAGDPWPSAEHAWGVVQRAARRYGRWDAKAGLAACGVVRPVVEAFGWESLVDGDADIVRGQFLRFYRAWVAEASEEARVPPAVRRGVQTPSPLRAVLQGGRWPWLKAPT